MFSNSLGDQGTCRSVRPAVAYIHKLLRPSVGEHLLILCIDPVEHSLTEGLLRIAEMLLNAAVIFECSVHIGASPFERSEKQTSYANGLKDHTSHSSLGALRLHVHQTEDAKNPTSPQCSKAAVAEISLQDVSTQRSAKVMEPLSALEVSSNQVSRLTAEPDETFMLWRVNRGL